MTYERNTVEMLLDAGSSVDWVTPVYEAIRNVAQDGRSYCIPSDTWHAMQDNLAAAGVNCWGVTLHWLNGAYWMTFSVQAEHAPLVDRLIDGKPNGGRGKAIFLLIVLLGFLAVTLALVAVVGGAL